VTNILNETREDYAIATREGVIVKITGVPTRTRTGFDGEPLKTHSMGVALRLEQLVRAVVAQDPTPGREVELEFA
jgi:hypothetical protein